MPCDPCPPVAGRGCVRDQQESLPATGKHCCCLPDHNVCLDQLVASLSARIIESRITRMRVSSLSLRRESALASRVCRCDRKQVRGAFYRSSTSNGFSLNFRENLGRFASQLKKKSQQDPGILGNLLSRHEARSSFQVSRSCARRRCNRSRLLPARHDKLCRLEAPLACDSLPEV